MGHENGSTGTLQSCIYLSATGNMYVYARTGDLNFNFFFLRFFASRFAFLGCHRQPRGSGPRTQPGQRKCTTRWRTQRGYVTDREPISHTLCRLVLSNINFSFRLVEKSKFANVYTEGAKSLNFSTDQFESPIYREGKEKRQDRSNTNVYFTV